MTDRSPDRSHNRTAVAATTLLVVALLCVPTAQVYATGPGASPDDRAETWLTKVSRVWTGLWDAVSGLVPTRIEAPAKTEATSSNGSNNTTDGSGGFDPGGDGGLQDPNGRS